MVGSNTGLISQAVIPFGGVKESGIGMCTRFGPSVYPLIASGRARGRARHPRIHEHQVHRFWWPLMTERLALHSVR
jgi:hypothetical protein